MGRSDLINRLRVKLKTLIFHGLDATVTVLANGPIVAANGLIELGWVEVIDGLIVGVVVGAAHGSADLDLQGRTLIPGFIVQHCHGGGGNTFITTDGPEARRAAGLHQRHGTTSLVASLVSGSQSALKAQIETLVPLVEDGTLVGIHLEGPWISTLHCGAHDVDQLRAPQAAEVDELLVAGQGHIKMVTIAPELTGGIEAVRQVADAGAIAAVGHTDADYETTVAAIDAGATVATHLNNAMRGLHHREPAAIGALLEDPRVFVELIADGVHVHQVVLKLVVRETNNDRVVLITDAMAAAGSHDGHYLLGELDVNVVEGVARLAEGGAIAGSTLTLDAALRFMVLRCGLSLDVVVGMLTKNPARALDLDDRGSIEIGKRADLVVLGHELEVDEVMVGGEWVSRA